MNNENNSSSVSENSLHSHKGVLITFEGIDGCGKSTQAQRLTEHLSSRGYTVHLLREPGGTIIGEQIRSILLNPDHHDMSPMTELFLYLAARAQITSRIIIPALENGDTVIMDRYLDSTAAYQGYARGLGMDTVMDLTVKATSGLLPDMTFVIDCSAEVAFSRFTRDFDRLEGEGMIFMDKVRQGFLELGKKYPDRIFVVDGNRKKDEIHIDILGLISKIGL